eukprot:SAG11_NODE_460_length_9258_cov_3.010698_1_plen_84_part_00
MFTLLWGKDTEKKADKEKVFYFIYYSRFESIFSTTKKTPAPLLGGEKNNENLVGWGNLAWDLVGYPLYNFLFVGLLLRVFSPQ